MEKRSHSVKQVLGKLSLVYVAALVVNYVWEMLQMPLYEGMPFDDPRSYLTCLRAAFGDANITAAIFALGRLLFGSWDWPAKLTFAKTSYLAILGAGVAIVIERYALATSRWAYTDLMPVIPGIDVGVVPVLQLMILPYLAYVTSHKLAGRT